MRWKTLFFLTWVCPALVAGPLDNWHSRTNFGGTNLIGIAHHGGTYVMVDLNPGRIITATNLTLPGVFSTQTVSSPQAVTYGAGRFVVTAFNLILSSTNGYDWEEHPVNGAFSSVIFAEDRFVAVGSRYSGMSSDGTHWTAGTLPSSFFRDVVFGNGIFLATGSSSNAISSDGVSWEGVPFLTNGGFYTVGFAEGKFVGITTGNNILTSTDARTWTTHGKLDVMRPGRIAWGSGYFVTAGGGARAYSDDGVSWTVVPSGTTDYYVEFINGRFVATGFKTIHESDPVAQVRLLSSREMLVVGAPGSRVRVEASDTLSGSGWEGLGTEQVVGAGSSATVQLPPAGPRRFFRAVISQ